MPQFLRSPELWHTVDRKMILHWHRMLLLVYHLIGLSLHETTSIQIQIREETLSTKRFVDHTSNLVFLVLHSSPWSFDPPRMPACRPPCGRSRSPWFQRTLCPPYDQEVAALPRIKRKEVGKLQHLCQAILRSTNPLDHTYWGFSTWKPP